MTTTLDLTVNAVINAPLLLEKCDELNGEDGISDFTLTDVVIPEFLRQPLLPTMPVLMMRCLNKMHYLQPIEIQYVTDRQFMPG
ncbi:hypothetical protein H9W95_17490 [Flavobacterium lindanitolerans]|nr:hypothetical protein [Flavobacterium lindanitolerans]